MQPSEEDQETNDFKLTTEKRIQVKKSLERLYLTDDVKSKGSK